MKVEIPDDVYGAIASTHGDVTAFVEIALRKAVSQPAAPEPRRDADEVLKRFADAGGLFGEASLDEVLAARREGLE